MSPVTHFFTGWVLANTADLNRQERAAVTFAAVAPDLDGLGAIAEILTRHSTHPLLWFSRYHHSLHNLLFGLVIAIASFAVAKRRWLTGMLALLAFHVHLVQDLLGSRGPDGFSWPIPYLSPITDRCNWLWHGQWALNAWPNFVLTIGLVVLTIWMARTRGFSPVDLFSPRADRVVVETLRARFPLPSPRP